MILAVGVLGFTVVSLYRDLQPPVFNGTSYDPPAPAPSFSLVDHNGQSVRLSDFSGRPVLLFFGYTSCPDVCPLTMINLKRALTEIGVGPDEAQIAMITVDPENDGFETLARFVAPFTPGVVGMTGSQDALSALYSAYGVHVGPGMSPHDMVAHTDAVFGIDRRGQLRVLLHPTDPESGLEEDLRTLMRL